MAGTLEISPTAHWSAASWLFYWTLRAIAADVHDLELSAKLIGIDDENLGWLSLADLTPRQREEVKHAATNLALRAERDFPPTLANRNEIVGHIRELVNSISLV